MPKLKWFSIAKFYCQRAQQVTTQLLMNGWGVVYCYFSQFDERTFGIQRYSSDLFFFCIAKIQKHINIDLCMFESNTFSILKLGWLIRKNVRIRCLYHVVSTNYIR